MARISSTDESTVQLTDGRRLMRLRYRSGRRAAATALCDLIPRRASVAGFLRQFGVDETFNRQRAADSLCVSVDHILDEVGGRLVDPAEWNVHGINLRGLLNDVRWQCGDDQKLAAFLQKLGIYSKKLSCCCDNRYTYRTV